MTTADGINTWNFIFLYFFVYCRSGNIREVLIFAYFARRVNLRIQKSRENYYHNCATKEKWKFVISETRENLNARKLTDVQYILNSFNPP